MSLETCNHCRRRVMPTDGICPGCRKPISGSPANQFSEQTLNPYSPPVATAVSATGVANPLFVSALILLVLWILWTCYVVFALVLVLSPTGPYRDFGYVRDAMVASYALMIGINLVSIAGAVAMLRQRSKWLAWTAAVLGLVPMMGPCFGFTLPVAIWAIVLLRRPDVNAQFT